MKHFTQIPLSSWLLLLFLTTGIQDASAGLIRGAELTYESLGGRRYEITLKIYKYCSDASLASSYDVHETSACGTKDFTLVHQSSKNITQTCRSACIRCSPSSSCRNLGLEEHIYQGTAVLLNNSCCERRIFFKKQSTREELIGISKDFYIECMINTCAQVPNNSPTFNLSPLTFLQPGRAYSISHGVFDKDADTLKHQIVASMEDSNDVYAINTIWNIDSLTGECSINHNRQTYSWLSTRAIDYRNGQKMGYAAREIEYLLINTDRKNTLPQLTGVDSTNSFETYFCVGVSNCFSVYSSDSNSNDSVFVQNFDSIPGLQFSSNSAKKQVGSLCWTPKPADAKQGHYYISIRAQDNDCDYNFYRDKVYTINLYHATVNPNYSIDSCGKVRFKPNLNIVVGDANKISIRWYGDEGFVSKSENPSKSYKTTGDKKYYVEVYHKQKGCILTKDSGVVKLGKTVSVSLPEDTTFCMRDQVNIVAQNPQGNGKLQYSWSKGQSPNDTLHTTFTQGEEVSVQISDALGCIASDTVQVAVFDSINFGRLVDSTVCPLGDSLLLETSPRGGSWSGQNLVNDSIYVPAPGVSNATQTLTYTYTDSNSCTQTKEYTLRTLPLPAVDAGMDIRTCETLGEVKLNPNTAGEWLHKAGMSNGVVNTNKLSVGTHEFYYKNTDALGCFNIDTMALYNLEGPTVAFETVDSICRFDTLVLNAQPYGGSWMVNGQLAGTESHYVSSGEGDSLTLYYKFIDSLGCADSATQLVSILSPPKIALLNQDTSVCANEERLQLEAEPKTGSWQGAGLEEAAPNTYFDPKLVDTAGSYSLRYQVKSQNGCENHDTLQLTVEPAPEAAFSYQALNYQRPVRILFSDASQGNVQLWLWQFTNSPADTALRQNPAFTFTTQNPSARVQLAVQTRAGCTDTVSQTINLGEIVGLNPTANSLQEKVTFQVYENSLKIQTKEYLNDEIKVYLYSMDGKRIYDGKIRGNTQLTIPLHSLQNGLFILHIGNGDRGSSHLIVH